ncbi:hypothetical protein [uncultured Alsobacter sp.]|uniref:hypothetical protein n=1 Tax=uncultured Alsobacter sp. TaxID=1748258 RepID=UPI0026005654|nr:hypothetical protein [uncultured Alsobacter sp.]
MAKMTWIAATAAILAAGMTGAAAQTQTMNVRGTITAFDGKMLSVQSRDGRALTIDVPEALNVNITKPFTLADVKPGMVLGVTTVKKADGTIVAIDVRPIPATANQGLSPHDLAPDSTMTNATLEGAVQVANGNELTLNYKSGTVKALVVPETAMSQAAPGARSDLKPGETVFVSTRVEAGDKLTAARIQVSKDGVKPTQ